MAINKVQTPPITDPNKPGKSGLWSVWNNDLKNLFAAPTQQIVGVNDIIQGFFLSSSSSVSNTIFNMQGLWAKPSAIPSSVSDNGIWLPANAFVEAAWGQLTILVCGRYTVAGSGGVTPETLTWKWFIDASDTTNPFETTTINTVDGASFDFYVTITLTFLNNSSIPDEPWTVAFGGFGIFGSTVLAIPVLTAPTVALSKTTQLGLSLATTSTSEDTAKFSLIQISKV